MDWSAWERGRGWQTGACGGRGGRGHQLAPSPAPTRAWPFRTHLTPDTEAICPGGGSKIGPHRACCLPSARAVRPFAHVRAPAAARSCLGASLRARRGGDGLSTEHGTPRAGKSAARRPPARALSALGPSPFWLVPARGEGSLGGGAVGAVTRPRAAGKNAPVVLRCRGICLTLSGACFSVHRAHSHTEGGGRGKLPPLLAGLLPSPLPWSIQGAPDLIDKIDLLGQRPMAEVRETVSQPGDPKVLLRRLRQVDTQV